MMGARPITELDLTKQEQDHVRNALYFLRAKFGSWKTIARLLRFEESTLIHSASGLRTVSASMAFRLARTVNITIDHLLAGKYPEPGVCPRCAYRLPLDGVYRADPRAARSSTAANS
jgi:hypothetical protein